MKYASEATVTLRLLGSDLGEAVALMPGMRRVRSREHLERSSLIGRPRTQMTGPQPRPSGESGRLLRQDDSTAGSESRAERLKTGSPEMVPEYPCFLLRRTSGSRLEF